MKRLSSSFILSCVESDDCEAEIKKFTERGRRTVTDSVPQNGLANHGRAISTYKISFDSLYHLLTLLLLQ
jgi:hypothetical protein